MQIDQGERKWDCTFFFLWGACVCMSLRADQASLILWKEYLRPSARACVLPLQNVFLLSWQTCCVYSVLMQMPTWLHCWPSMKFTWSCLTQGSLKFKCLCLHVFSFHFSLPLFPLLSWSGSCPAGSICSYPLNLQRNRGQMQELLLSWAVCRLNCLRLQQVIFLSNKCVAGTGTYFRIAFLHYCDTKHPASFERRQRPFLWLFL